MLVTIATARPLVARELAHVLPRALRAPSESCLLGGGTLVCTRRLPPRGPAGLGSWRACSRQPDRTCPRHEPSSEESRPPWTRGTCWAQRAPLRRGRPRLRVRPSERPFQERPVHLLIQDSRLLEPARLTESERQGPGWPAPLLPGRSPGRSA